MARLSGAQRGAIIVAVIGTVGTIISAAVTGMFGLLKDDPGRAGSDPVRVAAVSLTAPAQSFYSRCPITFRFNGRIDVEGGEGVVVYRWLRSDGFGNETVAGDRQRASVAGPGTLAVTDEWTPNVPVGQVARTVVLQVLEPRDLQSEPVVISGECDANLPPNPPIPPPQVPGGPPGG